LAKFCANCGTPFSPELQQAAAAETPEISPRPQSPAVEAAAVSYPQVPARARYGGFWIRFVAVIIDALVVGIVILPVSVIMALMIAMAGKVVGMPTIGVHLVRVIAGVTLSSCANWIYEAALESSSKQATLGKLALALKVTDLAGQRISFARATGRHFAKILSGMILMIGYIMAGFTERKQALHDMIAGTLVQRTQ
jgi:uncharacterized RDD family membrane protein YckC